VPAAETDGGLDLTVVTLELDARDASAVEQLARALARYVVMTRGETGCRNVDLCHSRAHPERFLVVEKWSSSEAHEAHAGGANLSGLASAAAALLARPPTVDVLDAVSAHDLE
jgi:quinol monooxygenase YgiN